jgi:hypothetical protein
MRQMNILILFILSLFTLCACAHLNSPQHVDLDQNLNQYIGQTSTNIQQNLNLQDLGYQTDNKIVKTDQELNYTILRPIRIPIIGGSNFSNTPATSDSGTNDIYDVSLQCKITFHLKNDIAQSISYSGKAC